jgi:hypothetical protein
MGLRPSLSLVLLTTFALGCANGVQLDTVTADHNAQGKADGVESGVATATIPELSKRYALAFDSTIKTQNENSEDPPKTVLTSILADVFASQDGERVTLSIQPCHVTLPELEGRQPEVASDVIQRISAVLVEGRVRPTTARDDPAAASPERELVPPEDRIGTEDDPISPSGEQDDDSAATDGEDHFPDTVSDDDVTTSTPEAQPDPVAFELFTETAAFVGGAHLDAPLTETLPEYDDDPRLLDLDEDGKPGISIYIGNFRAYASFRLKFQMRGAVGSGVIEGGSTFDLDSQIVGDDIPFVNAAKRARRAADETVIIAQEHRFIMTPIHDDRYLCDFEL